MANSQRDHKATSPHLNSRSAIRNASGSRPIYDGTNRVDNDFWLIDRHEMTGMFGDDLTPAFRKLDVISLQLSPCRVGAARARHNNHRNRELSARSPDLGGAFADMDDFVRGRLVSGGTESRCADESLN
jgi:hypothetical protein